jgi:selenide,water dikinase
VNTTHHDPSLLVGLDAPDDAAVYRISPDVAIVQTVDFFTPIVDDAYSWGRIAAANALSDVYAMGASPKTALNLVGWPRELGFDLLGAVIDGAGDACDEAGVTIVGGHSIEDPEPKFGLSVTGVVHPDRIVTKTGATPGSELILTKPLGMGIISSGIKEGKTTAGTAERAIRIMSTLNRSASEAMIEVGVEAATDVTGFGLIGHLLQMLDGRLDADLDRGNVPVLEEAAELAAAGILPGGSRRNREAGAPSVDPGPLDEARMAVLYDAQTSGGLLMAVPPGKLDPMMRALADRGVDGAARIGALASGRGRIRVG